MEPLSPLPWSLHLCASGWLLTRQTYQFSCLFKESKTRDSVGGWHLFHLGETSTLIVFLVPLSLLLLLSSVSNSVSIGFWLIEKTYPGCTTRPSLRSESALQWWFDQGSRRSHVWTSASHVIWCHHPRPTHEPWCGPMSCGIHWKRRGHKVTFWLYNNYE